MRAPLEIFEAAFEETFTRRVGHSATLRGKARLIGIQHSSLSRILSGQTRPSGALISGLVRLGFTSEDLVRCGFAAAETPAKAA